MINSFFLLINRSNQQKRQKQTSKEFKNLMQVNYQKKKQNVKDIQFICPEKCTFFSFPSPIEFVQHYIIHHHCPILYYDQPLCIEFTKAQVIEKKVLHRCIIKYMYQDNQYFLLEFVHDDGHCSITLHDFTFAEKSNFEFEIHPISRNFKTITNKCSTVKNNQVSSTPIDNFLPVNVNNEYCLYIKSFKQYADKDLLMRPGCEMSRVATGIRHVTANTDLSWEQIFILLKINNRQSPSLLLERKNSKQFSKIHLLGTKLETI